MQIGRLTFFLGILAGGILPAPADSNLLENSPFNPPANAAAGPLQPAAPLELRSILFEKGRYEFSIYDPASKQSTWAGLNETGHPFILKSFDAGREVLCVEARGRKFMLTLKEPTGTASAGAPARPVDVSAPVRELEAIYRSEGSEELILQRLQRFLHLQLLARKRQGTVDRARDSDVTSDF